MLYWKKKYYTVYIAIAPGGSRKFSEQPFKRIWELRNVEMLEPGLEYEKVVSVLKEALTVYGVGGARHQVPNTIIEFGKGFCKHKSNFMNAEHNVFINRQTDRT